MLTFHSLGYSAPSVPVDLRVNETVFCGLGTSYFGLPVGTPAIVRWQLEQSGPVGWGQVAICAGPAPLGNAPVRCVGVADATDEWRTWAPGVQGNSQITLVAPVEAGEYLWAAFAQWTAPTFGPTGNEIPSGVVVKLAGSDWTDPTSAGNVGAWPAYWKPSENVGAGFGVVFNAFAQTKPIAAHVLIGMPGPVLVAP